MTEIPVHWQRRLDRHSECQVVVKDGFEDHLCRTCPHGWLQGFYMPLTGDERVDLRQRLLKMRAVEEYANCSRHGAVG